MIAAITEDPSSFKVLTTFIFLILWRSFEQFSLQSVCLSLWLIISSDICMKFLVMVCKFHIVRKFMCT